MSEKRATSYKDIDTQTLRSILHTQRQNLGFLERRAAYYGYYDTPIHIRHEIYSIREVIADISSELQNRGQPQISPYEYLDTQTLRSMLHVQQQNLVIMESQISGFNFGVPKELSEQINNMRDTIANISIELSRPERAINSAYKGFEGEELQILLKTLYAQLSVLERKKTLYGIDIPLSIYNTEMKIHQDIELITLELQNRGETVDLGDNSTTPSSAKKQITMLQRITRYKLRQNLIHYLNEEELKDLCFDIHIDYDTLSGSGKGAKIRELITYCERNGRITELINKCQDLRPNVNWEE
jgi:hypothetical protein